MKLIDLAMKIQRNYITNKLIKYSFMVLLLLVLAFLTYRTEQHQGMSRFFQNELLYERSAAFTGMYFAT